MAKQEQRKYEINYVLERGKILAQGTFTESNIPSQMPSVDERHTLVGVIDNPSKKIAADIRNEEDYNNFLRTFSASAFINGGKYLVCSLPKDTN